MPLPTLALCGIIRFVEPDLLFLPGRRPARQPNFNLKAAVVFRFKGFDVWSKAGYQRISCERGAFTPSPVSRLATRLIPHRGKFPLTTAL